MPSSAARLKRSAGRSDCVHGSGSRGVASKAAASSWAARCRSMAIEELNKPASECACGSVWIRIGCCCCSTQRAHTLRTPKHKGHRIGNSSRGALHVPVRHRGEPGHTRTHESHRPVMVTGVYLYSTGKKMWSVCLCASACPVCPVCVPAPPGVFLPVKRYRYSTRKSRSRHEWTRGLAGRNGVR